MNLKSVYEPYRRKRISDACKATASCLLKKLMDSRRPIIDSQSLDLNNFMEDYGLSAEQVVREADQEIPRNTIADILCMNGFEEFTSMTVLGEADGNWDQLLQFLNAGLSTDEIEDLIEGITMVFDLDYAEEDL